MRNCRWLPIGLTGCLFVSGCSAEETITAKEEQVIAAFEAQGIELTVSEHQSEAFDFPAADETTFDFTDGSVLIFTGYDELEQIQQQIKVNLAEMEFPYPVDVKYFRDFTVIVMPESDNPEIAEQIEAVSQVLKEL